MLRAAYLLRARGFPSVEIPAMIPIDPAISIDGYRYVHIMLDDFREEDISRSPLQWSPEWQDARLDAAVRYMMAL